MSILSTTDVSFFTGAAADLFNQASSFHTLIVHKKPTKILININADSYNGYGGNDNPNNYTLVPNSGIYNVVVVSVKDSFESTVFDPVPLYLEKGQKLIKVNESCRNFISNGENELFVLDGQSFNSTSSEMPRTYGNLTYWYYMLEKTT
jgi:hypothetical protein